MEGATPSRSLSSGRIIGASQSRGFNGPVDPSERLASRFASRLADPGNQRQASRQEVLPPPGPQGLEADLAQAIQRAEARLTGLPGQVGQANLNATERGAGRTRPWTDPIPGQPGQSRPPPAERPGRNVRVAKPWAHTSPETNRRRTPISRFGRQAMQDEQMAVQNRQGGAADGRAEAARKPARQ